MSSTVCLARSLTLTQLVHALVVTSPLADEAVARVAQPLIAMGAVGAVLLDTVEVFLRTNGSTTAAAESLFVHRNTVSYRLVRVERLTGLGVRAISERSIWTVVLIAMGRPDVLQTLESKAGPSQRRTLAISKRPAL